MKKIKAVPTKYKAEIKTEDRKISRRVYEKEFLNLGKGFIATEPIVKFNKEWYELVGDYRKDKVCRLGNKIEGKVIRHI